MKADLPKRKTTRLAEFDYSTPGDYFVTICTKGKSNILSDIVGTGVLDGPQIRLFEYGKIAEKYILSLSEFYNNISVEKYVIMPNHIHLIIKILNVGDGPSGTPVPTLQNSILSRFISTFKRFCNKECGKNIWQYRSYEHIIRGEKDFCKIWDYIENNPICWQIDRFYN